MAKNSITQLPIRQGPSSPPPVRIPVPERPATTFPVGPSAPSK
jgi:hypothetical protein